MSTPSIRLSVSNIAWAAEDFWRPLALVKELGCDGLELAASLYWPEPIASTQPERLEFRNRVADHGLELTGLHALLFTRPDLRIFDEEGESARAIDYLERTCELCRDLGGKLLVFGSPRNRRRGPMPLHEAFARGAAFFRKVAEAATAYQVFVLIEPLGSETDFISSGADAMELIRQVDHPNFQLLLDAKAMVDVGEDIDRVLENSRSHLKHFHASERNLSPVGSGAVDHRPFARGLRKIDYRGFVSIEMRNGFGPPEKAIPRAIRYVRECYLEDVEP